MRRGGTYETTSIGRLGTPSEPGPVGRGQYVDARRANLMQSANWFGPQNAGLNLTVPTVSGDLDAMVKAPHATTGIPYAISGTATNVQVEVAQRLSGFQDPIKAIMGVVVHGIGSASLTLSSEIRTNSGKRWRETGTSGTITVLSGSAS